MLRRTKIILFPALLLICIGLAVYAASNVQADSPQNSTRLTDGTNAVTILSKAERAKMSNTERLQWLEKNGEVPEDAEYMDWYLSQKTSWWGKPLDPKKFWKDRPIWPDDSSTKDAKRHGRLYPPIPSADPSYVRFSDKDMIQSFSGGVETPSFPFHLTDREMVFWDDFAKTQPKPPAALDHEAQIAANDYFNASSSKASKAIGVKVLQNAAKSDGKALNYPPEEFTDDALLWTYVMAKRKDYEQDLQTGLTTNSPIVKHLLKKLLVDPKFITDPLSTDQIKAANAWKVAYLQRLQNEKVDKSYIDAYLQAWNLPAAEVFGQSK